MGKKRRKRCPESSAHKEKTKCPERIITMWVLPLEDYDLKIVILKDQMDTYGLHYSRKQVQNHVYRYYCYPLLPLNWHILLFNTDWWDFHEVQRNCADMTCNPCWICDSLQSSIQLRFFLLGYFFFLFFLMRTFNFHIQITTCSIQCAGFN